MLWVKLGVKLGVIRAMVQKIRSKHQALESEDGNGKAWSVYSRDRS